MENKNPCIGCGNAPNCTTKCAEWDEVEKRESVVNNTDPCFNCAGSTSCMEPCTTKLEWLHMRVAPSKTNEEIEIVEKFTREPAPETFNEIFAKFDAWYWDKYRHHPEEMLAKEFYKFLNGEVV